MFKRFPTIATFFTFAGVLFGVLSIVLIFASNQVIRQSFMTRVKNSTERNIQFEAKNLLKAQDFSFEDKARIKDVFRVLFQRIKTVEIIRIKVWDAHARIIFSDDESIVGKIFTDNEEFQEAIKGETITELQIPVKSENISEKGYKQLAEVYVPIMLEGNSRPAGVIEIYFKLDHIINQINETQKILVITIISFVSVSLVLLFVLFRILVLKQTEFLRNVIDTDPNLIFVKDWNGVFTLVNKATAEIYNTTVEDLVGKRDADFNSNSKEVENFLAADRKVMQSLKPYLIKEEIVTSTKTGKKRWFQTIKVPIVFGSSRHVLGIATDITDHKKALELVETRSKELENISKSQEDTKKAMLNVLEDLQVAKSMLELGKAKDEAILASIGDGVIATGRDGNIIVMNHMAEVLLEAAAKDFLGKLLYETLYIYDDKDIAVPLEKLPIQIAISTGKTTTSTYYIKKKNGNKFPVAITATPIISNKDIVGAVEILRDVTREKEIEKAKTEFVSITSHELRTPLTAIDGLVSMILNGEYGPVGKNLIQPLEDVNTSSERLIHLVNDLLNLSRIQAGRLKYNLSDFSIFDTISEVIKLLSPLAQQKKLKLKIGQIDKIDVQGDRDKVEEIFDNLIGNSLKFTDKGSITVSAKTALDKIEIAIADTGIGISKENQQKLFGIFQQLVSLQKGHIGTGLGLHISREIARKMGGDVLLKESELGKGSIFTFSLPIAKTPLATKVKEELEKETNVYTAKKAS